MNQPLAVVPKVHDVSRPDISWIKKNVPILGVAHALGLRIRRGKAQCWRTENHRHGDSDPSLSFFEKRNRCRCFVCDMKGGHSNVDLVIGVLNCDLGAAVLWIAERFQVPKVKVGRPVGQKPTAPPPYRIGCGSEWEVIVRSGMWGRMTSAERSVLVTLDAFKDPDTGLTQLSYRAIMRYSGVRKFANVSGAIKELRRMHALQHSPGQRIGVTLECSSYRVTLNDPKFLELCNAVSTSARQEIGQEREYRASQKRERQKAARKLSVKSSCSSVAALHVVTQNITDVGGAAPLHPPSRISFQESENTQEQTYSCEGQDLSSPGEVHANKTLPAGKRETGISSPARRTRRLWASKDEREEAYQSLQAREANPRAIEEIRRQKAAVFAKHAKPVEVLV
jgi:hypothetical protein